MKRILVVTSDVPFVEGGHRAIARCLRGAFEDAGHASEVFTTPQNRFGRQLRAYLATRLTDVELTGDDLPVDGVVSLKYPSYAVRHPRHVCWLVHTMREYYDLWDSFRARLSWRGRIKEGARRRLIHRLDRRLLGSNVKRLFAISATVSRRLECLHGIKAEVLYPPPPPLGYTTKGYEPFLLAYSRLDRLKRFDLVLEAFGRMTGGLSLRIGGDGPERKALEQMAAGMHLRDRVTFLGRLSPEALVDELSRCRAVVFVPVNEDMGFVTLEAFRSRKPVITASDSGGPLEFVKDGETGLVSDPDPEALASAMERAAADEDGMRAMGSRAERSIARLTWEAAARTLLDALGF